MPKKQRPVFAPPKFYKLSNKFDQKKLSHLLAQHKNIKVCDDYLEQQKELFYLKNPHLVLTPNEAEKAFRFYYFSLTNKQKEKQLGTWVFFPWLNTLTHILEEEDYFKVRTSRNQKLIYPQEQKAFYNAKVGIGGLSIGSSVATALIIQGGAKSIKIADFDRLALSNTNRIRASINNLGEPKTEILAKQLYEINPYQKIEIFSEGLTKHNIKSFVKDLDIVIDELDSFPAKIFLREEAKKQKKPVIMGADVGNSAIVDIERYDLNQKTPYFNGRLGKVTSKTFFNLTKQKTGEYIAKLLGKQNHENRMLESLSEIGKSIVSWPQLGGTAILNASALSYIARMIITKQRLNKNRYIINLKELLA
ncbi:MAG: ThiF family adenylyltransferase [Candidatus Doudnabacteria bacterium]|nr:ThiF family adenylyltransferase [Candidatus Doudnabacteria bacterium]